MPMAKGIENEYFIPAKKIMLYDNVQFLCGYERGCSCWLLVAGYRLLVDEVDAGCTNVSVAFQYKAYPNCGEQFCS